MTTLRPDQLEHLREKFRCGVDFIHGRARVCHLASHQVLEFPVGPGDDINMAILVAADVLQKEYERTDNNK